MRDRLIAAVLVLTGLLLPAMPVRGETPCNPVLLEDFAGESSRRHLAAAYAAHERRRALLDELADAATSEEAASATLLASRTIGGSTPPPGPSSAYPSGTGPFGGSPQTGVLPR